MGWYYIRDWPMGTTESLACVVLIGFSVDYIIHYSAEYMHSKEETRDLKMRQSLRQMGVSIFSGFLTTFGAGIFLISCSISFFWKFGEVISLAVTVAFFIATFTYGALMKTMGPVGNQGDIMVCFNAMRGKKKEKPAEEAGEKPNEM
jgi:predicted RND superfamily exporter protein